MIHPSVVKWDYFENIIPLLQKKYHLLVPALPGYDFENDSDYTSVERIASELNDWLKAEGYLELYAVYGCSMGGSIALMTALGQKIRIRHCVMDGGITPYQLPWIVTRFIALRDYLMMMIGRAGGVGILEKAFATDDYSREDLQYVADVLRHCSGKNTVTQRKTASSPLPSATATTRSPRPSGSGRKSAKLCRKTSGRPIPPASRSWRSRTSMSRRSILSRSTA